MLCAVIKGPSLKEARKQIIESLPNADCVELRLDHFDTLEIKPLKEEFPDLPMIFTLRPNPQVDEDKRLRNIQALCSLAPVYFDIEHGINPQFLEQLRTDFPAIKWIYSYHDFQCTSDNLEMILQELHQQPADYYKLALSGHSTNDALRLITLPSTPKDIRISMGPHGLISRLSPSPFTYVAANEACISAPGQLTLKNFMQTYHFGKNHLMLGLIGGNVAKSISEITHNAMMKSLGIPGTYVKMQVEPHELEQFIDLARKSNIHGLSVTMPHKETIIKLLDEVDPEAEKIGAVNTLVFAKGKVKGYNTDASGALEALGNVNGKDIVILGAGGAALAIAYEARKRGASVNLLTRTPSKHKDVDGSLDELDRFDYDILINCTPSPMPVNKDHIQPGKIVMDITNKPKNTEFLVHAKANQCQIIYGYKMFVNQAVEQFRLWFGDTFDNEQAKAVLIAKCEEVL